MQETTTTKMDASSTSFAASERYVKIATRFFRVKESHSSKNHHVGDDDDGGGGGDRHHFLDACFLCKRRISRGCDIFMYRGDAPFCSDDCRTTQIEMDEALETVARRHRMMMKSKSSPSTSSPPSSTVATNCAANESSVDERGDGRRIIHRRPTIANLAARTPMVAG